MTVTPGRPHGVGVGETTPCVTLLGLTGANYYLRPYHLWLGPRRTLTRAESCEAEGEQNKKSEQTSLFDPGGDGR
jgi:hypothetical protein